MFIVQDLSLFCHRLALFLCDLPEIHPTEFILIFIFLDSSTSHKFATCFCGSFLMENTEKKIIIL